MNRPRALPPLLTICLFFVAIAPIAACHGSSTDKSDAATTLAPSHSGVAAVPSTPMNAAALPSASVAAMVNPANLPPYTGPTGSLEGTISVKGDPAPSANLDLSRCPQTASVYGKTFREGATLSDGSRQLADALVVITGYQGAYIPERQPSKTLDIHDCAYATRTVDLTYGQKLLIANKDAKMVYAPVLDAFPTMAVMVPAPNADPITLYPEKPGFSTLSDRMGSPLTADVYVLLQPLHAVSDTSGHYRIDGIPIGKVDLNVRLRAINHDVTKPVEIHDGVVEKMDVVVEYKTPIVKPTVDARPRKPNLR